MNSDHDDYDEGITPESLFKIVLWATIILLALLYIYAQLHVTKIDRDAEGKVIVSEKYYEEWKQVLPEIFKDSETYYKEANFKYKEQVDKSIDGAFEIVYQEIPVFLDFHYSVIGEYSELSAAVAGKIGKHLERILFLESGFDKSLENSLESINREGEGLLTELLHRIREDLRQNFDLEESEIELLSTVATLSMDDAVERFGPAPLSIKAAGTMAGTVAIVKTIGSKLSTKLAAKLATKIAGKSAASAAGFGSGAVAGGAAGLLCGPAALVCAPVAALVTGTAVWFGTDKLVLEVDEYFNRDEFEQEIRTALDKEKKNLKRKLVSSYREHLNQIMKDNEIQLQKMTVKDLIQRDL